MELYLQDVLDHITGDQFSEFREFHSPLRFRQNLNAKWQIFAKASDEYSKPLPLNRRLTCEDAFIKCSMNSKSPIELLQLVIHPAQRR